MPGLQKCSSQFNIVLLLATSGLFLTESTDDAEPIFYSELGKPTFLNIHSPKSIYNEISWFKGNSKVAKYKNGSRSYANYEQRAEVFQNGTLKFNIGEATDEGEYRYELCSKDGKCHNGQHFKLHLLVSVSKPVLDIKCNSPNKVNITCYVKEGTGVTLKLLGDSLNESDKAQNLNKIHSFKKTGAKKYTCIASNKISETKILSEVNCPVTKPIKPISIDYNLIMAVAGAVVLVIILSILVIYCFRRHTRRQVQREDVMEHTLQTELKVPMEFREQMKLQRQPVPVPGQHHEEYTPHPQPQPRKSRERGERMDSSERAQRGERPQRGERGQREENDQRGERAQRGERGQRGEKGQRGERAQRGETAQRGERVQRGDRMPRMEKRELKVDRGPVPLPPQK
uniref:T-cell surface antigen CD2-like n=1 Tax=Pristiophorus japonicus TaxID=55135 RepID=UPI00398F3142